MERERDDEEQPVDLGVRCSIPVSHMRTRPHLPGLEEAGFKRLITPPNWPEGSGILNASPRTVRVSPNSLNRHNE